MAASSDALGEGFVTSLARPDGNITGMTVSGRTRISRQAAGVAEGTRAVRVSRNGARESGQQLPRCVRKGTDICGAGTQGSAASRGSAFA
jgi:hypothetical protein